MGLLNLRSECQVDLAMGEGIDQGEIRDIWGFSGVSHHHLLYSLRHTPLAPPAYVQGIETHSPSPGYQLALAARSS
jgi:hypothetical protein